jgi:hypothetical protein
VGKMVEMSAGPVVEDHKERDGEALKRRGRPSNPDRGAFRPLSAAVPLSSRDILRQ